MILNSFNVSYVVMGLSVITRSPPAPQGFPGGASGQELSCQLSCRRHKRFAFDPRVGKIPWRRAGQPTPVFLPGESYGQSLAGYDP